MRLRRRHHLDTWFEMTVLVGIVILLCISNWTGPALAQQPIKETMPGVTNLARLETTVACAGAIDAAEAVPAIKKMGFVSIINLREANEPGANIEKERDVAERAGLRYVHVPFNAGAPDPTAADRFLAAITTPGVEPAFIHCAGGNRAAAMWLIKRLVIDQWDVERATREAAALGLTNPALQQFAIDYARKRGR
jgi:uncharacterized protein (TIGR01244 family)